MMICLKIMLYMYKECSDVSIYSVVYQNFFVRQYDWQVSKLLEKKKYSASTRYYIQQNEWNFHIATPRIHCSVLKWKPKSLQHTCYKAIEYRLQAINFVKKQKREQIKSMWKRKWHLNSLLCLASIKPTKKNVWSQSYIYLL